MEDYDIHSHITSQQHASVSQGWICFDKFMCRHAEIEVELELKIKLSTSQGHSILALDQPVPVLTL